MHMQTETMYQYNSRIGYWARWLALMLQLSMKSTEETHTGNKTNGWKVHNLSKSKVEFFRQKLDTGCNIIEVWMHTILLPLVDHA